RVLFRSSETPEARDAAAVPRQSGARATPAGREAATPAGTDPIRVLIVDDHALFRRGLEMVLQGEDDIEVIGEGGDGHEAVEMAGNLLPDVVLTDSRMPPRSGIEACTAIKDAAPSEKAVMLTISHREENLVQP